MSEKNNQDELILEAEDVVIDNQQNEDNSVKAASSASGSANPEGETRSKAKTNKKDEAPHGFMAFLYYLPFSIFCCMIVFGGIYLYFLFTNVEASDLDLDDAHPTDTHIGTSKSSKKETVTIPEFSAEQIRAAEEARKAAEAKAAEAKAAAENAASASVSSNQSNSSNASASVSTSANDAEVANDVIVNDVSEAEVTDFSSTSENSHSEPTPAPATPATPSTPATPVTPTNPE